MVGRISFPFNGYKEINKNVTNFKKTNMYKRDFRNKKMHLLKNLQTDSRIVKSDNKELSHSSSRIPKREKRLNSITKQSFHRKNASCDSITLKLSAIAKTSILIFIFDVLITQCSSQIDLGKYLCYCYYTFFSKLIV